MQSLFLPRVLYTTVHTVIIDIKSNVTQIINVIDTASLTCDSPSSDPESVSVSVSVSVSCHDRKMGTDKRVEMNC